MGLKGGSAKDALDFGARSNWGNGIEAGAYGQNENSVSGYGRNPNTTADRGFNSRAAHGIGGRGRKSPCVD